MILNLNFPFFFLLISFLKIETVVGELFAGFKNESISGIYILLVIRSFFGCSPFVKLIRKGKAEQLLTQSVLYMKRGTQGR
jgi:hypothetical protein